MAMEEDGLENGISLFSARPPKRQKRDKLAKTSSEQHKTVAEPPVVGAAAEPSLAAQDPGAAGNRQQEPDVQMPAATADPAAPADTQEDIDAAQPAVGQDRGGSGGAMAATDFRALGLTEWLEKVCKSLGMTWPTEVQRGCIPSILQGRDVIGTAHTGSGKTAAFALPILQLLAKDPFGVFALVMTPTRELAFQIAEQFRALGAGMSLKETVIIGGLDMHAQAKALAQRPHVVIATPGRLRGLVESDPTLKRGFARTRFLVLDEADRLLEASFEGELRCIVGMLPAERQTLLFSATMTRSLVALQSAALRDAYHFQAYQGLETAERLRQEYMFIPAKVKDVYLAHLLGCLGDHSVRSAIIFCSTCKGCALLSLILEELGVAVAALHSHMSQGRRLAALQRFKAGAVPILLATDVASRGLDIPTVDLVVNYDLPILARDYVHRVGRTARAGRSGWSLSFVTQYDVDLVQKIEALIDKQLAAFAMEEAEVLKGITKVYAARRTAALKAAEQSSRDSSNNRTSGNKGRPKKPAATAQEG